jgi:hypothetical protein
MSRSIHCFIFMVALLWAMTASAQEAYVYISADNLTYAYDASSTGKLTPIQGTPFQTKGNVVGTNGKFFMTLDGSGNLRAYKITSDGGISEKTSEINTQLYISDCAASVNAAELDHTGSYIYAEAGGDVCSNTQTFKISTKGELTFQGVVDLIGILGGSLPKVTGNDKFAYAFSYGINGCCSLTGYSRESATGVLNSIGFHETDPSSDSGYAYYPYNMLSPDPTNHLAVAVTNTPYLDGDQQLASYTVDSHGDVTSTNTWENMPTLPGGYWANDLKLDPTGKYLAVAYSTGIQLFHFNGAKPITTFTGLVGVSGSIPQMAWDSNGHLYGLNSSGKMHVYDVTSKGMTETSGSRTVVPVGPFVVRSK